MYGGGCWKAYGFSINMGTLVRNSLYVLGAMKIANISVKGGWARNEQGRLRMA